MSYRARIEKHFTRLFSHVRNFRKTIIVLGLVLCLPVASVGVVKAVTASNAHNRAVVLFAGDSNIVRGATQIVWTMTWKDHNDNAYVPVFASRVGATIRTPDCLDPSSCTTTDFWKTKLSETFSKINPDVVVTDLGVNDTTTSGTATTPGYGNYGQKIDWFMRLIPSNKPVLWTNLPCNQLPPSVYNGCQNVNFALSMASKRWPNLTILNWGGMAYGHPEYMADPGKDQHLSPDGEQAWTNLVLSTLDSKFPAPTN